MLAIAHRPHSLTVWSSLWVPDAKCYHSVYALFGDILNQGLWEFSLPIESIMSFGTSIYLIYIAFHTIKSYECCFGFNAEEQGNWLFEKKLIGRESSLSWYKMTPEYQVILIPVPVPSCWNYSLQPLCNISWSHPTVAHSLKSLVAAAAVLKDKSGNVSLFESDSPSSSETQWRCFQRRQFKAAGFPGSTSKMGSNNCVEHGNTYTICNRHTQWKFAVWLGELNR